MFLLDIFFKMVYRRGFRIGERFLCQTHFFLVNVWLVVTGFSEVLKLVLFESLPSEIFHSVFLLDFFDLRIDVILSGLIFVNDFVENLIFLFIILLIIGWAQVCISEGVHGAHHGWSLDLSFRVSGIFGVFLFSCLLNLDLFFDHFPDFGKLFFSGINIFSLSNLVRFEPFDVRPTI